MNFADVTAAKPLAPSRNDTSLRFGHRVATACAVVEPALLAPPDVPIRGGSRPDAAMVLDRELTKLAGMHSYCRFVRASLALRLMDSRAWRKLGFVRLSDYARERLGCSPRVLEEDARVLRRLSSLPACRSALERGVATWTAVRAISSVADASTEKTLLSKALQLSTRELDAYLKQYRAAPDDKADAAGEVGAAGASRPTDVGTASTATPDPEDQIRWHVEVSRVGRRLWRSAVELSERHAGSPLPKSDVLELVVAEAMAGLPFGEDERSAPPREYLVRSLTAARRRQRRNDEALLRGFLAEYGVVEGFDCLPSRACGPGPAAALAALLEVQDPLDATDLDKRLRELRLAEQRIDGQIGALLRILVDRRFHRLLGFPTLKLYVESRLGFSSRRAWSLLAVERVSWRLPDAFRRAWMDGTISHLAATLLLPVLNTQNARAWIERARQVTLRRLSDEIGWSIERAEAEYHTDMPPGVAHPRDAFPPPVDADVRAASLPATAEQVQMRAHGDGPAPLRMRGSTTRLTFDLPLDLAVLVETAIRLHQRPSEPTWLTFERLLAMAVADWSSVPRHRDPVFERDGWRCAVPCCSSRRNLHDHHLLFRSRGGGNERDNRITICADHHLHAVHAGIIRAHGRAPDAVLWEMPGARLLGDRYLAA